MVKYNVVHLFVYIILLPSVHLLSNIQTRVKIIYFAQTDILASRVLLLSRFVYKQFKC